MLPDNVERDIICCRVLRGAEGKYTQLYKKKKMLILTFFNKIKRGYANKAHFF